MPVQARSFFQRPRVRLVLTIGVIVIGLAIAVLFTLRSVRSFREFQYIRQQGLDQGTASVNAIRPWMTIRFIAVAYAVPEEYLYSALGIPFDLRNADRSMGDLNRDYKLGISPTSTHLVITDKAEAAILAYRANPVATGLRDVRPWMSVRYIANGSGVEEQTIFTAIGIPASGNENKPLDLLAEQQHYRGGPPALADTIQRMLSQQKATP